MGGLGPLFNLKMGLKRKIEGTDYTFEGGVMRLDKRSNKFTMFIKPKQ